MSTRNVVWSQLTRPEKRPYLERAKEACFNPDDRERVQRLARNLYYSEPVETGHENGTSDPRGTFVGGL